jgi:hypothetical protein
MWFLQEPHSITSQKTPFFIVTAVKTSNLTTTKQPKRKHTSDTAILPANRTTPVAFRARGHFETN